MRGKMKWDRNIADRVYLISGGKVLQGDMNKGDKSVLS